MECWKTVPGFSRYEVSDHGRIRNVETKSVFAIILTARYSCVSIIRDDDNKRCPKKVHRLVAQAFIPNAEDQRTVDRVDRNRANIRFQICTGRA